MKFQIIATLWCVVSLIVASTPTVSAQSYEPEWNGEVAVLSLSPDTTAITAEKCNVAVKTGGTFTMHAFGFGSTKSKIAIKGNRSTVQLPAGQPVYLVVKCRDNDSDPSSFIQVVKLEETKKERKAELSSYDWKGDSQ